MAHWLDRDNVIVRVATLDDDPAQQVALHIWTEHDVNWLADGPDVVSHAGVPAQR